jgi:(2Fe-2S) ferredoxin
MVEVGDQPKVTYGKVTPDVARQIMKDHVINGKPVENHVIPM